MSRRERPEIVIGWALVCGPVVAIGLQAPLAAWSCLLGYHAICVAVTRLVRPGTLSGPRKGREFTLGLGSLGLMLGLAAVTRSLAPSLFHPIPTWVGWGLQPPGDLVWLAYYAAVNPWIEERFWRGALLSPAVRSKLGAQGAVLVASCGFAGHHGAVLILSLGWREGMLLLMPIIVVGATWVFMRQRTGGLSAPIASHIGADLGLAILYRLWLRG